jgi:hypothetical protein
MCWRGKPFVSFYRRALCRLLTKTRQHPNRINERLSVIKNKYNINKYTFLKQNNERIAKCTTKTMPSLVRADRRFHQTNDRRLLTELKAVRAETIHVIQAIFFGRNGLLPKPFSVIHRQNIRHPCTFFNFFRLFIFVQTTYYAGETNETP